MNDCKTSQPAVVAVIEEVVKPLVKCVDALDNQVERRSFLRLPSLGRQPEWVEEVDCTLEEPPVC